MVYKRFFLQLFNTMDTLQIIGGAGEQAIGPEFEILVWNMYKGRRRGWEDDFQTMIRDKDIVLLQESVFNTRFDPIFQAADSFEWVMARSHTYTKSQMITGIKTGAVVKSQAQSFFVSPDFEPLSRTPKILLATLYPVEGSAHPLLVVNVHAINFVGLHKFNRQVLQITEAIGMHEGPIILAGDFNTWNIHRYKSLFETVEKMGLKEAAFTRKGRIHHFNQHLDHIFYRGLKLEDVSVMASVISSDHFPLTARFRTL